MPLPSSTGPQGTLNIHASCVRLDGQGVLISGPSGAGKSALALQLMALGAQLVADDRTILYRENDGLFARAPETLAGLIEARGVGILRAPACGQTKLALCVDLGTRETDRLPPFRSLRQLGIALPLLHRVDSAHFAAAIVHYLQYGRHS